MRISIATVTLACVCLAGFGRCAAAQDDSAVIRGLLSDQAAAWNQGDGAGWARNFAEDADFVNLRGDVLRGSTEISKRIARSLGSAFKGSRLAIGIRRLVFLAPNVAMIDTNYDLTGFGPLAPGVMATENGVLKTCMKYVAVKKLGKWHFVAAQNTVIIGSGK